MDENYNRMLDFIKFVSTVKTGNDPKLDAQLLEGIRGMAEVLFQTVTANK